MKGFTDRRTHRKTNSASLTFLFILTQNIYTLNRVWYVSCTANFWLIFFPFFLFCLKSQQCKFHRVPKEISSLSIKKCHGTPFLCVCSTFCRQCHCPFSQTVTDGESLQLSLLFLAVCRQISMRKGQITQRCETHRARTRKSRAHGQGERGRER